MRRSLPGTADRPHGSATINRSSSDAIKRRSLTKHLAHEFATCIANVLFAGDRYVLAGEGHQSGVLRGAGRFTVDGEEDGAIVAKDDECGTVFRACPGTSYADGFVETLGVGACRINDPTGDRDVGAAIRREGEAGCSDEDRCRRRAQHFVAGHAVPCHFGQVHLAAIVAHRRLRPRSLGLRICAPR